MSIMSNSWYDVPPLDHFGFYDYGEDEETNGRRVNGDAEGRGVKAKVLWDSGVRWDPMNGRVVVQEALDLRVSVRGLMERGPSVSADGGTHDPDLFVGEDEGETESDGEGGEEDEEMVKEEEEEEETMDEDDD